MYKMTIYGADSNWAEGEIKDDLNTGARQPSLVLRRTRAYYLSSGHNNIKS